MLLADSYMRALLTELDSHFQPTTSLLGVLRDDSQSVFAHTVSHFEAGPGMSGQANSTASLSNLQGLKGNMYVVISDLHNISVWCLCGAVNNSPANTLVANAALTHLVIGQICEDTGLKHASVCAC
jgi:hypothetical protein